MWTWRPPGLNAALTRTGSLSGAVQELRDAGAARAAKAPGSAVEGLEGGMSALVDALVDDIRADGRRRAHGRARARRGREDGSSWLVTTDALDTEGADAAAAEAATEAEFDAEPGTRGTPGRRRRRRDR